MTITVVSTSASSTFSDDIFPENTGLIETKFGVSNGMGEYYFVFIKSGSHDQDGSHAHIC